MIIEVDGDIFNLKVINYNNTSILKKAIIFFIGLDLSC